MSIAVKVGVMRWSIAFLRWAIMVLRKAIGILWRTIAVLRQAVVVFGWTIGITDSMVTFRTIIVTLRTWRAGRTLVRTIGSCPAVHLAWPLRSRSVQGDEASTAGRGWDRGWSKLVAVAPGFPRLAAWEDPAGQLLDQAAL